MKIKVLKPIVLIMIFAFSFSLLGSMFIPINVQAYGDDNPIVVISMGDSYSAGEGIEPFYGQTNSDGSDIPRSLKIHSADWFAHRSTKSWPSLLKIGDFYVRDYKKDINCLSMPSTVPAPCEWYFVAASGAVIDHFDNPQEKGKVKTRVSGDLFNGKYIEEFDTANKLDPQLKVFEDNGLYGKVDYVTMTIGGNDLGFTDIVINSAKYTVANNPTFMKNSIEKKRKLWFKEIKQKLMNSYQKVYNAAGPQVEIIVAGYPELYYRNASTWAAGKDQRKIIDDFVVELCDKDNGEIKKAIDECNLKFANGKIHYVSVIEEFQSDGGHGADAPNGNEWINGITLTGTQMIDESDITQKAYPSMHPKEAGAQAYARCVNAKIEEIEGSKGTLSGKICKASDRSTAISGATINVYKNNNLYTTQTADTTGNYSINLPAGQYYIDITAEGYINFHSYVTVSKGENTYLEAFLKVGGTDDNIETENVLSFSGDHRATVTACDKSASGTVKIPHKYNNGAVVEIGSKAFSECICKKVIIPASVATIADDAFDANTSITIKCSLYSAAYKYAVKHNLNYELTVDTDDRTVYLEDVSYTNFARYEGNEKDSFINQIDTRCEPSGLTGTTYSHGLEAWVARWNYGDKPSWVWNEYEINGAFKTLCGVIDISSNTYNKSSYNTTIQIIGDGNVLFEENLTPASSYPVNVNVDVSNVKSLKISLFDNSETSGGTSFLLGDFRFVK